MKNSLQSLIREAFNTAYKTHKAKAINENADTFGAKLNQSEKSVADEKLNVLVNKLPGYKLITWDPSGKRGGLSQNQQNYIIEKLAELYKSTRDEKYKQALGQLYQYTGTFRTTDTGQKVRDESPLWKTAYRRFINTTALDRLEKQKPGTLYDFLAKAWADTFGGGKFVSGANAGQDIFDALINDYKPTSSGFGAYLSSRIVNRVSNEIQNATATGTEFKSGVTSLDKPLTTTGKAGEYGEEDSDLSGEDPEAVTFGDEGEEELDATSLAGQGVDAEVSDEPEDIGEPDFKDSEESEAARINAKEMIEKLELSLTDAIEEYRSDNNPTPNQEKGFVALEAILSGLSPQEATSKLGFNTTTAIQDLKKNKAFTKMVDLHLRSNGFVNSRGKTENFINISPQWIADAAKFKLTGEVPKQFPEDRTVSGIQTEPEIESTGLDMKDMQKIVINAKKSLKWLDTLAAGAEPSAEKTKISSALQSLLSGKIDAGAAAKNAGYTNVDELSKDIASLKITDTPITPQDIADSAKSLKLGRPSKVMPVYQDADELSENRTFWFLEEIILKEEKNFQKFLAENLDKVMDRVYKRLSKKLNG